MTRRYRYITQEFVFHHESTALKLYPMLYLKDLRITNLNNRISARLNSHPGAAFSFSFLNAEFISKSSVLGRPE